jgi:4-amino-4-deoxy-L-arabinose transferase-like glycosyltransferase
VIARGARLSRQAAIRHQAVLEAGAVAGLLAIAAFVWSRDLHTYPNFDEGNYLGSLDALRHGQHLGRDVFLDQPPGWYVLLVAVSYPFGNSVSGVRTGLMVTTLAAIVAAYACGRLLAGPTAGLAAGAVMAVARPLAGFAGLVESEPASAALAAAAVAVAVAAYTRRARPGLAFLSGVLLALSTSVKLPGATAGLPIAALAVLCGSGPLVRRLLPPLAGVAAVVAAFAAA